MIFEKLVRIPHERVAILIGKRGTIKSQIERKCNVQLDINSTTGEILIVHVETPDAHMHDTNVHLGNMLDNTPDTTLDNTPDTTLDNTPDTTLDNTPDTTLDNTPDTTLDNTPDTTLDNTPDTNNDYNDGHKDDLFLPFKAVEIVMAIGRGFTPDVALTLLKNENSLFVINLTEFAGKSRSSIERIKGRVIGERGRARKNMEQLSKTHISVYGKTVSIIGAGGGLMRAVDAVRAISCGSTHGAVYNKLEVANRHQKQQRMILWEDDDRYGSD